MIKEKLIMDAVKELKELFPYAEEAHQAADLVLTELLEKLGYKEVVEEYKKISKWYE